MDSVLSKVSSGQGQLLIYFYRRLQKILQSKEERDEPISEKNVKAG
jgi:hypothetical protein